MQDGLIPNYVDEGGSPHYNSADASLWFAYAVQKYAEATGDYNFIRQSMWQPLRSFLSHYIRGNVLISMDSDCLLRVSDPAGTWMDARVNGSAATPRKGKPVELNALWYSSLHFLLGLSNRFEDGKTRDICGQAIETLDSSFQKFLASDGGLFDVLEPNNPSLRPNQIFAVSLPNSPLNNLQKRHVFNLVRSRLYTPLGLRTLSPEDSRYHDKYSGSPEKRDSAYHQGAIWPWLLGAFFDAQLRVYPGSESQVLSALRPFAEAMKQGCIGSIPEIYEPATMRAEGALCQAWSVAEILRIYTKVKRSAAASAGAVPLPQRLEHGVRA
jgi:predicted glycogen debranching enzyme